MRDYCRIIAYTDTQIIAHVASEKYYKHGDYLILMLEDASMHAVTDEWFHYNPETKIVDMEMLEKRGAYYSKGIYSFAVDDVFVISRFAADHIAADIMQRSAGRLRGEANTRLWKDNGTLDDRESPRNA